MIVTLTLLLNKGESHIVRIASYGTNNMTFFSLHVPCYFRHSRVFDKIDGFLQVFLTIENIDYIFETPCIYIQLFTWLTLVLFFCGFQQKIEPSWKKLTLFEPLNQVEQNTANIQTALDLFSSNSSMIGTFVMKELKHNMFLCTYSLFTWFHLLYWLIVQVSVIVKAQYFYSFNNNSQSKQNQKISTHHSWDIY